MSRTSRSRALPVGVPAILLGIAALTLRTSLDLHGFLGGLLIGAGIALVLLGVACVGGTLPGLSRRRTTPGWLPRRDGASDPTSWLPSRDRDDR